MPVNLQQHEKYMRRCLELARLGMRITAPNPMVGSVIVYNDCVIGEGYHHKYGEAHAETNAVCSVKDLSLLEKATLYVNLEPCSHFGKTPPCTDLILEKKIPNVVIGTGDSNIKVAGKGIETLKKNGCKVITGVLEKECRDLNCRFFTFHEKKRPYVILKWAQTLDGFIDRERSAGSADLPVWITDEWCRTLVHKWRSEEQSILIGTNTAGKDNPRLNIRNWNGKNPLRIVIDRSLRLPDNLHLLDRTIPTLVLTEKTKKFVTNIEYIKIPFDKNMIPHILKVLFEKNIQSLIVEGGALLLQSFINADLWDEARVFTGNTTFQKGIKAPEIKGSVSSSDPIGEHKLTVISREADNSIKTSLFLR